MRKPIQIRRAYGLGDTKGCVVWRAYGVRELGRDEFPLLEPAKPHYRLIDGATSENVREQCARLFPCHPVTVHT